MPDTPPEIVDSHCHLDFDSLKDDLPDVVSRAEAAGVTRMVTICTKLREAPTVRAIAEAHAPVFWAAGTHPMSAATEPLATVEALEALAAHPKFVGIGESGLDYHYTAESKAIQTESLRLHVEAARRTGLPLIIHARDADEDMASILADEHRPADLAEFRSPVLEGGGMGRGRLSAWPSWSSPSSVAALPAACPASAGIGVIATPRSRAIPAGAARCSSSGVRAPARRPC